MNRIAAAFLCILSFLTLADDPAWRLDSAQHTLLIETSEATRLSLTSNGVSLNDRALEVDSTSVRLVRITGSGRVNICDLQTSTLRIESNASVYLSGTLHADSLEILAPSIEQNGSLHVTKLTLQAAGKLDIYGSLEAPSEGDIRLLGRVVHVHRTAHVVASDDHGGGLIRIGGELRGRPTLPSASLTVVESGAILDASAPNVGDAGSIVVWSNQLTRFAGSISAHSATGNGAAVEVSGKGQLDYTGSIDTSARHGRNGTVLFDPQDIDIAGALPDINGDTTPGDDITSAGDLDSLTDFPTAPTSTITVAALRTILAGSDVTLAASRNITLNSVLDFDGIGNTGRTLTLNANASIFINSTISDGNTGTADKLNVILNADADHDGSGAVEINADIQTRGGNLSLSGSDDSSHGVYSANALNTNGGNLTITGSGYDYGVLLTSEPLTGGGALTIHGISTNANTTDSVGIIFETGINHLAGSNIDIEGTSNEIGVLFKDDLTVTAAGTLKLIGNSNGRHGILFRDTNLLSLPTAVTLNAVGDITLTGTGTEFGIYVPGTENHDPTNGTTSPLIPGSLDITSTTGKVTILADSTVIPAAGGTGTGRHGFCVQGPVDIQADGNVSITARGTQFAANFRTTLDIVSTHGSVNLNAVSTGKYGIWTGDSTHIQSGQGTTITGSATEFALCVAEDHQIDSGFSIDAGGAVSVTGTSTPDVNTGTIYGLGHRGIWVQGPFTVDAGGDVAVNGTAAQFALEVYNPSGTSNRFTTTSGSVTLNGISTGGHGIHMFGGLTVQGTQDIAITGSGLRHPISIVNFPTGLNTISTTGGAVTMDATCLTSGEHTLQVYGSLQVSALNDITITTHSGRLGFQVNGTDNKFISSAGSVSLTSNDSGYHGINLYGNLQIAGHSGVTINGSAESFGVALTSGSNIQIASAAGSINMTGNATLRNGMDFDGPLTMTAAGNISISGTSGEFGVAINDSHTSTITSTGGSVSIAGNGTLNGQSENTNRYGVEFCGSTTINGATGVTINGKASEFGVVATTGPLTVNSSAGSVSITADSSITSKQTNANFFGVGRHGFLASNTLDINGETGVTIQAKALENGFVGAAATHIVSANGLITINADTTRITPLLATLQSRFQTPPEGRHPFFINAAYTLDGAQGVTLIGRGRVYGVELIQTTTPSVITPTLTSSNGPIIINGTSLGNGVTGTHGVLIGGDISGNGVSITGLSVDTNVGEPGVLVVGGTINSNGGALEIAGVSESAQGVMISKSAVLNSSGGELSIDGTSFASGPNSSGVRIDSTATARPQILSSGGPLNIEGHAGDDQDIYVGTNTVVPQISAGAGTLTLNANSVFLQSGAPTLSGTGAVVIQPRTSLLSFQVGGSTAPQTAYLSSAELLQLANGFSSITLGAANGSGTITLSDAAFSDNTVIRSPAGSGAIKLAGAVTTSDNANLTLTHGGALTLASGKSIATAGAFAENGGGAVDLQSAISGATATFNDSVSIPNSLTITGAPVSFLNQVTLGSNVARTLTVNGGLTLGTSSTLNLDVPSFDAGAADSILITGPVSVGGTLNLNLAAAPTGAASATLFDNDGTDAITGKFSTVQNNFPAAALRYAGGDGNDLTLVKNTPPAIQSIGVTQAAIPAVTPYTFTPFASDLDGQTLSFSYDYGDGSPADSTGKHTYTTNGTYTVTLTVSDGIDSVAQTVIVTTGSATALDSDGDGYSDAFEKAAGSNPLDSTSVPQNTTGVENATKLSIKLNFAPSKTPKDAITLTGSVTSTTLIDVTDTAFVVSIGGVTRSFTLNSKGAGKVGSDTALVTINKKATTQAKYSIKIVKASLASSLAAVGLTNTTVTNADVTIPILLLLDNSLYTKNQQQTYTAKQKKSGATTDKKN